ncbi:MAG: isoleucine--tRNA ligase [Candidatus Thorarchaeota archaeon]
MVSLEFQVLEFWKENKIFEKRWEQNKQTGKHYSFIDGPITANNPMGMHHTWGRSLKDIIQRYWTMQGYDQRYQNGFDCQGLWVEVEVEKDLNLNSKRAIEEYGLENFSIKCKERIEKYSSLITEQSQRLGQWMNWDNSYYTHTDTNISYIWYFLKKCYENGWLIKDYLPMPWCPRCGTSLSQHEQHDAYKELTHTSVYVKFPLINKNNEFLLVWTTTPWTLTANTAVAVHPDLKYLKVKQEQNIYYIVKARQKELKGKFEVLTELTGKELIGCKYTSPFGYLSSQKNVSHKVISWKQVGETEGTGFVHIAPGCGAEDFELSKINALVALTPIDEFGIFLDDYDEFTGLNTKDASLQAINTLQKKEQLYKKEQYKHRYPTCWRCHEELVFRLVEEWFIECKDIQPKLKEAAKKVEWIPKYYSKRMQDWLNNMGNWCISRKRYWGLPLPFYECKSCGKLTVIGSKQELLELAVEGTDDLKELHRPWIDSVKIKCQKCGNKITRVTEVGDCWLDAGIVPFSTLQYLENREYWEKWFPAQSVCEMREQIRLWFYSLLFMSVTITGEPPYKRVVVHEKVHDKDGKPMHRSWGNAIWFADAVETMGADILRWISAKQSLSQSMNFGYYLQEETMPYFITLWNAYSFFATFANLDNYTPKNNSKQTIANYLELSLMDKWLISKSNQLKKDLKKFYEKADFRQVTLELEKFVEQLSTWYIRRSRRRFWKDEETVDKANAYDTLYETLLDILKLMAPITPFFSEVLYQNLTKNAKTNMPISVHLCDFPKAKKQYIQSDLNNKMETVLEVVKLGRAARNKTNQRLRQPLEKIMVWCRNKEEELAVEEFKKDILAELNIKQLQFVKNPRKLFSLQLKPNYKILGPKLKKDIQLLAEHLNNLDQKTILEAFNSEKQILSINLANHRLDLKLDEDVFLEAKPLGSFAVTVGKKNAVALETKLTEDLVLEGIARDVVRQIQDMRKLSNFQVNDTIEVYYSSNELVTKAIESYKDYIMEETLAIILMNKKIIDSKTVKVLNDELLLKINKKNPN